MRQIGPAGLVFLGRALQMTAESVFQSRFRYFFDRDRGPGNHLIARWLFLRSLGLIYFSAFLSLIFQIRGMIGIRGILPAAEYLNHLRRLGAMRFFYAPTVAWLSSTDTALLFLCWVGLASSVLVVINLAPRPALLLCFLSFLSFIAVSQDFGEYQSDGMLLEAGFLALFLAPRGLRPALGRNSLTVRAASWLLLWEWFRIYFESGVVKLESGDPTWRNLTAMYEYYQNGPLPTWVGWYLQHLPNWFHIGTAAATLLMELLLIWMAFLPGRWRIACFWIVTAWQAGVILSANYAFLNYLVLVLGFLLLEDGYLSRLVPSRWRGKLGFNSADTGHDTHETETAGLHSSRLRWVQPIVAGFFLSWICYSTSVQLILMFWRTQPFPVTPVAALEPFRVANAYGLFAVMTPHRYEIEFQGSNDGQSWTPYPFRHKPQEIRERPDIYAPYQPRFDWNLWFASLGPWQQAPIVPLTQERLLEGSPAVLSLFRANPFPGHPPRYVRAVLWQYWFTTYAQKQSTGEWWRREMLGTFAPTLERLPNGDFSEVSVAQLNGPPTD